MQAPTQHWPGERALGVRPRTETSLHYWSPLLTQLAVLSLAIALFSPGVQAAAESARSCDMRIAPTVYVKSGRIVGGPDHGKRYRGVLRGTPGHDIIHGTPGADSIEGARGDDVICGFEGDDTIKGQGGHDLLFGGKGADTLYGGGGGDRLWGGRGADQLWGGDGRDRLYGNRGADSLRGGKGADRLHGNRGTDQLYGEAGGDYLSGGLDGDQLFGGNGNDELRGAGGKDQLDGGRGTDRGEGGSGDDRCTNIERYVGATDSDNCKDELAAIELELQVGGADADTAPGVALRTGEQFRFDYLLTNTGDLALSDLVLSVQAIEPAGAAAEVCRLATLAVGQTASCRSQSVVAEGLHHFSATVVAQTSSGELTQQDPAYYSGNPVLSAIPRAYPSDGEAPLKVAFSPSATTDSAIARYEWDFDGDGSIDSSDTVGRNYSWTYKQSGSYNARLRVTDTDGRSAEASLTISVANQAPQVQGEAQPSNGAVPLSVSFSATASDNDGVRDYGWDFDGDGNIDQTTLSGRVQHVYTQEGDYQPAVTVTDTLGASTRLQVPSIEVWVGPEGTPSVAASASPATGKVPLTVSLAATASGLGTDTVSLWEWDFDGDGAFDHSDVASASVSHSYSASGSYYARVRASTAKGLLSEDVVQIVVQPSVSLSLSSDTLDVALDERVSVDTQLGGSTQVSVVIEAVGGGVVRTLVPWSARAAGRYSDSWDGRDDAGHLLPAGQYRAIMLWQHDGQVARLDLGLSTGGRQYNPPRSRIPRRFSPYAGEPLVISYTLSSAAEVTAFMGRYNSNTRLLTFHQREPQGRGRHAISWHGENSDGQLIKPPPGDRFLFGIFAYTLPENAIVLRNRIELSEFKAAPAIFTPSGRERRSTVSFELSQPGDVQLRINDTETGLTVREQRLRGLGAGAHSWHWDGRNDEGDFVAAGSYRLGINASSGAGGRSLTHYALQRVYY